MDSWAKYSAVREHQLPPVRVTRTCLACRTHAITHDRRGNGRLRGEQGTREPAGACPMTGNVNVVMYSQEKDEGEEYKGRTNSSKSFGLYEIA